MIFGVLFSNPDSVQNPFAIFCIFCISTLIKETKLSLKFVCVAKIKFINCKIYLFHNLFVSSNMTAINMNFSPFFYSDHRDSGLDAAAGAESGPGARPRHVLREQPQTDRPCPVAVRRGFRRLHRRRPGDRFNSVAGKLLAVSAARLYRL